MQEACFLGTGRRCLILSSSPQPKDLVFGKDKEHNTSCEHNEAIFTRLCVQMGSYCGPTD